MIMRWEQYISSLQGKEYAPSELGIFSKQSLEKNNSALTIGIYIEWENFESSFSTITCSKTGYIEQGSLFHVPKDKKAAKKQQ